MRQLSSSEHDRDLHLVALAQELRHLPGLGVEVARADLGPVLHLFDARAGGLAPGLLGPLGGIELELAVVHDPAHRGVGVGGHLDQVEILLAGDVERLRQGFDPQLGPVGVNQSDLPCPDPLVHPVLGGVMCSSYRASLL